MGRSCGRTGKWTGRLLATSGVRPCAKDIAGAIDRVIRAFIRARAARARVARRPRFYRHSAISRIDCATGCAPGYPAECGATYRATCPNGNQAGNRADGRAESRTAAGSWGAAEGAPERRSKFGFPVDLGRGLLPSCLLFGLALVAMASNPRALGVWNLGDFGTASRVRLRARAMQLRWGGGEERKAEQNFESNPQETPLKSGRCSQLWNSIPDRRSTKKELEELRRKFNDSDPSKRRTAVNGLARLGGDDAWSMILEALADADGRVADQAQLRLGESASPVVLKGLLGRQGLRAKDDWIRRRSAEALGRFQSAVELSAWIRALGDSEETVRSTVCWSIERLAERSALPDDEKGKLKAALCKRLEHDREPAVRARALFALAAMQCEELDELLLRALKDSRRPELRCAALLLVSGQSSSESSPAQSFARQLLRDPEPSVRAACIGMLGACGNAADMLALAGTLSSEERLRLRWRVVSVLRRNSGLRYGLNPRPWQAWAARLPDDWRPVPIRRDDEIGSEVFDGLPVLSDRLSFLVDFSGSLWNAREDGLTRKQFADRELERALGKLADASKFNLVPYTGEPHPWRDELQVGRPKLKKEALHWFQSNRESGQGNVCAAIAEALGDPLVDSLVIMTDGAPTGGRRWNLELMMDELIEANRLRCIAFDIVLVDAPGGLVRHWRRLADSSGGELAEVQME